MSNDLVDSLIPNVDEVLGVRDQVGAVLKRVQILTRTWSGSRPGDGSARDSIMDIKPTPGIKEYAHDVRLLEGGSVRQGDILLKGISKNRYPREEMIDCSTDATNVERFYLVGDKAYTVINVKESYLTWDILVRRRSDQTRYGGQNG